MNCCIINWIHTQCVTLLAPDNRIDRKQCKWLVYQQRLVFNIWIDFFRFLDDIVGCNILIRCCEEMVWAKKTMEFSRIFYFWPISSHNNTKDNYYLLGWLYGRTKSISNIFVFRMDNEFTGFYSNYDMNLFFIRRNVIYLEINVASSFELYGHFEWIEMTKKNVTNIWIKKRHE